MVLDRFWARHSHAGLKIENILYKMYKNGHNLDEIQIQIFDWFQNHIRQMDRQNPKQYNNNIGISQN